MPYIVAGILIIAILRYLFEAFTSFITLQWMPSGIYQLKGHDLFDGNIHVDPVIPLIGSIIDYIVAAIINLVDFMLYPLAFIPGINNILHLVYTSPDLDLAFNEVLQHRSFLSHSVLNPVFLGFILIGTAIFFLLRVLPKQVTYIYMFIFLGIALSFPCHLLSDTMPKAWQGAAYVNFKLFGVGFSIASQAISELWLYANAAASAFLSFWVIEKGTKDC